MLKNHLKIVCISPRSIRKVYGRFIMSHFNPEVSSAFICKWVQSVLNCTNIAFHGNLVLVYPLSGSGSFKVWMHRSFPQLQKRIELLKPNCLSVSFVADHKNFLLKDFVFLHPTYLQKEALFLLEVPNLILIHHHLAPKLNHLVPPSP